MASKGQHRDWSPPVTPPLSGQDPTQGTGHRGGHVTEPLPLGADGLSGEAGAETLTMLRRAQALSSSQRCTGGAGWAGKLGTSRNPPGRRRGAVCLRSLCRAAWPSSGFSPCSQMRPDAPPGTEVRQATSPAHHPTLGAAGSVLVPEPPSLQAARLWDEPQGWHLGSCPPPPHGLGLD